MASYLRANVTSRIELIELCQNEARQRRTLQDLNNAEAQLKLALEPGVRAAVQAGADRAKRSLTKLERRHTALSAEIGLAGATDDDAECD